MFRQNQSQIYIIFYISSKHFGDKIVPSHTLFAKLLLATYPTPILGGKELAYLEINT